MSAMTAHGYAFAVDMAVNDSAGRFCGFARAIEIPQPGDELPVELEPSEPGGVLILLQPGGLVMHGGTFPFERCETHYGAMAWNRYWFRLGVLWEMFDRLWDSGFWTCVAAPSEFACAWDREMIA